MYNNLIHTKSKQLFMKNLLLILVGFFASYYVDGQTCTATITPSGSTAICSGSSVVLTANGGAGSWTKKADFGGTSRSGAVGFSIADKGYIGTGYDGSGKNDFWEFNPATNTWTQKANFGGAARWVSVGFSIGNKGYIGTGYPGYQDFWEYNPATNIWTKKSDFSGGAISFATGFSIGTKGYVAYGSDIWEYVPATDIWTKKALFPGTPCSSATGFSIGTKGYIGTGVSGSTALKDFWEYDPAINSWTRKADFNGVARWSASGFSIGSKGYIGIGYDGAIALKDFWEYNPATDSWVQKADVGNVARHTAVGFSIGGKGFIGTGDKGSGFLKDFWEYDPSASYSYLWSNGATTPSITVSSAGNYKVTITNTATGCSATSAATVVTVNPNPTAKITPSGTIGFCNGDIVRLFADSGKGPWTKKANFGGGNRTGSVGFSIGDKGYIGTGYDGSYKNDFWEYNPTTNIWTQKADFIGGGRVAAIGFSIGNKGYIGTGYVGNGSVTDDFWEYNPATNIWTEKAYLGKYRYGSIGFSIGNYGYIIAGLNGSGNLVNDFWQYDPDNDIWNDLGSLPGVGFERAYGIGFSIGNKGYFGTGNSLNTALKDFWEYDPNSGGLHRVADFGGVARWSASGFSIGSKGYIGAGYDGTNALNDFWEYNPATDSWVKRADAGSLARYSAVGFSIGNKGYIGTGDSGSVYKNDFWEYDPSASFSYLWSNGATTPSIAVSNAGNYTVTVTNTATGCSATSLPTVLTLLATSDTTVAICNSFIWFGTSYSVSGNYTHIIPRTGKCDSVITLHLTIKTVNSTFTKADAGCYGAANGAITVTPTNGVAPYQYRIGTAGSYGASNTFTGLKAGTYKIYIIDSTGCTGVSNPIVVDQKPAITIEYTKTNVACFGSATGSFTINGRNGVAPYTYRYGTTGAFTTTNSFTNLKAGSYRIYVQDAMGCIANFAILISQPPALSFTYSKTDANCFGANTGSITIAATGGKTPYRYRLGNTGSYINSNTFTSLAAGTYVAFLKDSNNCTFNTSITVGQPTAVSATINKTSVTCFGLANGSFTAIGTGGMAPYTYKLGSATTYSAINSLTTLKSGVYPAYIKDVTGCIGLVSVTIVEPAKVVENFNLVHPSCYGESNGSIVANGIGGTPPYLYKFGTIGSFTVVNRFIGLKAGSYRVYVQDANGCTFSNSAILIQPAAISASYTKTDERCPGAKDGSTTVTGAGGTPPYTYRFGTTGAHTTTNTFSGLKAGSYRVFVNDANGCTGYSIGVAIAQLSPTCFANPVIIKAKEPVVENKKEMKVTLSPNPSSGIFTLVVHSDYKLPLQLRITDATGKMVYTAKGTPNQAFRFGETLSTGVYMVEVRQGEEVKIVKAVKIR